MSFLLPLLRRVSRAASFVPAVLLVLVAACSDGATAPDAATGNVTLDIGGIPSGAAMSGATFKITRPDKEILLTSTGVTSGVPTGSWTFVAPRITVGGFEYRPEPETQTVVVNRTGTINARVNYLAVTGTLTITASGLPALVGAEIGVTGPNGFVRSLTTLSETLNGLAPGQYTITARRIRTASGSYDPVTASQDVVVGGSAASTVALLYGESLSNIAVDVTGLPLNADAAVTLTTPAGATNPVLRSSRTAGSAGRWHVNAAWVRTGGYTYVPTPAQSDSSVLPGDSLRFAVRYTLVTGAMAVAVTGVPAGTAAQVSITGPGGFARTVSGTTTITDLEPGVYTLTPSLVTASGSTYRASPASRQVTVEASLVAAPAAFSYAQVTSTLVVNVNGAPGGSTDMIRVTGPGGFDRVLSASTTLDGLTPGAYTVAASDIVGSAATWRATPLTSQRTIAGDDRDSVAVNYAVVTGSVAIMVSGLPDGVAGNVQLTGPSGFAQAVTGTTTITRLVPGTYTLAATNITAGGTAYVATPTTRQITVAASLVAAPATVVYDPQNATLVVTIAGSPQGAQPQVVVTGPAGFTRTISASTTFSAIGSGSYTVTAPTFSVGTTQYVATPASAQRTLVPAGRDSVGVTYTGSVPTTGSISVNVTGLPASVSSAITLAGPSTNRTITASATINSLSPGAYTLTATSVTSGGTTYNPAPTSQGVSVTAGNSSAATVAYAAAAVPTSDDLSIEYAYVTQAVQRADGSLPLVAGRAALLRVFGKNSRTNVLKPDVRVRLYDGTTLFRTITIAAPEASVRTAVDESVLASSWNTTLTETDMRPGLRILVDIDPANAVSEGNDANNVWPFDGAPRALTVSTVPTFSVRFVPVTVGALTGNVTVANATQFLRQTRLMLPIESIAHDVRLPFVSSATALQSGDGNGEWLTVLSEMNALRGSDGAPATMHYYGVVKVSYTSGVAGYGYVSGRAAMGWDYQPSGDGVAAHEWGHNFGRPHTPCGVSGDASYPYSGGSIGVYGWNSTSNSIVLPNATDFMSYCNNNWTSDWTWQRVLTQRASAGAQGTASIGAASTAGEASRDGLMVWGRIVNGRVMLEPAFRVTSPVSAPVAGSVFHVEALDAAGRTLLDLPIDAPTVDHVTSHEERQFAVVVPWTASLEASLATLRVRDVRTPLSVATRTSETARRVRSTQPSSVRIDASQADPAATLERTAARDRLRWNSAAFPLAVVRDAATGQTLSFVRRSGDGFISRGRAVDVTYSDGVRSVTRRVEAGASR